MSFETVRCAIHVSACKQTRDVHLEARKTFKLMCVLESNMNIRSEIRTNLHSTVLNQLNLFTILISTKFGIYLFIYSQCVNQRNENKFVFIWQAKQLRL